MWQMYLLYVDYSSGDVIAKLLLSNEVDFYFHGIALNLNGTTERQASSQVPQALHHMTFS